MTKYPLRDVDPELWKQFKARAAGEGRTIKFVLLELIRAYADNGFRVVETFNGKAKQDGHR